MRERGKFYRYRIRKDEFSLMPEHLNCFLYQISEQLCHLEFQNHWKYHQTEYLLNMRLMIQQVDKKLVDDYMNPKHVLHELQPVLSPTGLHVPFSRMRKHSVNRKML